MRLAQPQPLKPLHKAQRALRQTPAFPIHTSLPSITPEMNITHLLRIFLFSGSYLILLMVPSAVAASDTPTDMETVSQPASPSTSLRGRLPDISTEIAQAESSDETTADDGLLRITVTGTRTPRTLQSSPTTVTVIDAEDVNRLLIRDISDLTRYEPGVSVRNNLQFGLLF